VQSLANLRAQFATDEELRDERAILDAVNRELQAAPPFLATATGEWDDPYLTLCFKHKDGTALRVTQGDGYTAVGGKGLDYKGYLETADLIEVLKGALVGGTTYVRQTRAGHTIGEYFETVGREGQRLGVSRPLGTLPVFLRLAPFMPESRRSTRISFQSAPGFTFD
jgi:hypothetical protein